MRPSFLLRAAGLFTAGTLAVATATLSGSASADGPAASPARSGSVPAEVVHAGETTSTVRVGPFVLPTDGHQVPVLNQFIPNIPKPCEDCFITAVEPRLVNAAGETADMTTGVMLHHVVIAEPGKDDVTCARNDDLWARWGGGSSPPATSAPRSSCRTASATSSTPARG